MKTCIVVPDPEKLETVPDELAGSACASFVNIAVTASAPVPPSCTATIAIESKATSF